MSEQVCCDVKLLWCLRRSERCGLCAKSVFACCLAVVAALAESASMLRIVGIKAAYYQLLAVEWIVVSDS